MEKILARNIRFLQEKKVYFSNKEKIKTLLEYLNTNKIVIISGLRHTGKTKFLIDFLQKTGTQKSTFYYNHDLDNLGKVKTKQDIQKLIELFEVQFGTIKMVVLQNCNKIEGIKSLIQDLYKTKKYKIILIGNNIHIEGVPDIEICPLGFLGTREEKIENFLHFGGFEEVHLVRDTAFRKFVLESIKNDIISRDIVQTYNIKNTDSFTKMISFLGMKGNYMTQRELQRELIHEGIDISLITMMEYLSATINSKLLKRMYQFDTKKNKEIQTKVKYYFSDVGLRYAITHGEVDELLLRENMIYNELVLRGYTVRGVIHGRFEMDFSASKEKKSFALHIHQSTDKNELKKDIHKMNKLPLASEKILIVKDIAAYHLRNTVIDGVQVMEIQDFLKII